MTLIRINPESIKQTAETIKFLSGLMLKASECFRGSANNAPSYEGQFAPLVNAIGLTALVQAKKNASQLNIFSGSLYSKASAFQAADSAGVMGLKKSKILPWMFIDTAFLAYISMVSGLTAASILRLISLGMLGTAIQKNKSLITGIFEWITGTPGETGSKSEQKNIEDDVALKTTDEKLTNESTNEDLKYPSPPTSPKLTEASPQDYPSCALYAQARRTDLGSTQSNNERFTDQAAANYICKFEATAFQISVADGDLKQIINEGYAVVWEPGVSGADETYGHVAIVEEVGTDFVTVSEQRGDGIYQRNIPIEKLKDLWLIP